MSGPIRVLELRSVRGVGGGPEKTIIAGAGRADGSRLDVTVCYLRDGRDSLFAVDRSARHLGARYTEIVERHSFDAGIWPTLRALVADRAIDIVHSHDYKTDLLAWLLARAGRVVPLATAHGWTGHSARERWIYYPADKRLLARFPAVIAVSGEIRTALVRAGAGPDRVIVVPNGIDAAIYRRNPTGRAAARRLLEIDSDTIVIGSVGRLEPQKRFDLLVQAFQRLRFDWSGRPLTLVIAGEGSARASLERQAASLGLAGHFRLLGQRTDVIALHNGFDMFVQSSDYEGTSNALLEAMALETPAVATDVGGTADLVRSGIDALLVAPGGADRLEAAMRAILDDPAASVKRAKSARQRVERDLSFDARIRKVEMVCERLIDERGLSRPIATMGNA